MRICPADPELLFNQALAHHLAGQLDQAASTLQTLLAMGKRSDYIASVDVGILSYKARHNLGAVYEQMGRLAEAEQCWRQVIAEQADFLPAWLALGEALIAQQRDADLEALARHAQQSDGDLAAVLLRGRLALRKGNYLTAQQHFREAIRSNPKLDLGYRFLSHALLQAGERQEVEGVLRQLIALSPEDGEAHHNLGSLMMERERFAEAAAHYQRSVELRPEYTPSREMLQEALRKLKAGPKVPGPVSLP